MQPQVVYVGLSSDESRLEVQSVFRQENLPLHDAAWDGEWFGPLDPPP